MRLWLTILLLLFPSMLHAQTVAISSGEHPGFTRLVMQFGQAVNWQVGRGLDGYVLRIEGRRPDYDMSKVFDLIGKSRLAAIWPDPETGDLHFGIACACYALPFEFRPGIVVVDLHDGHPPPNSAFEQPLDLPVPSAEVPAAQSVPVTPPAVTYDWTSLALEQTAGPGDSLSGLVGFDPTTPDLAEVDAGLEALRLSLLQEMGRGASEGIVDMARPKESETITATDSQGSIHIHLGETPDLVIRQKGEGLPQLTAQGETCISDETLDLAAWGADRPVWDQIGPERQGLTGEFDRPDPDAVTRSVRFMLFIGFGAEARALMRAFPDDLPDAEIWTAMAHILDEDGPPGPAFVGMQACDTAAALWATLGDPDALPVDEVGKAAVLRSFSALPPQLRRLLGPKLVQRFVAAGDLSVATALRDAILRAPGDPTPDIVMMQAAMSRAAGAPSVAETQLQPLAESPGPGSANALVYLVEQRVALGQSIEFSQVQTLETLLKERTGGPDEARYRHALILARAASGDIDRAFAEAADAPETAPALWKVLAVSGPDSALLTHAVMAGGDAPPLLAKPSAAIIADRLLGLGLADQAALWVAVDDKAPDLLKARIKLAQGNAKEALALVSKDDAPMALAVKAAALEAMQDDQAAADVFAKLGRPEDQWAAIGRSQAWDSIAAGGPDPWKTVASMVTAPAPAAPAGANPLEGPLARNKALVADSAATRDAITALLDTVKSPAPPTQ